ncbi:MULTISPECIES: protoporphyrinogen oxidase [Ferrimicrobium]|uniref:Coproporphyrinogen III oxidase n=1 Tax=Ferrimicrobium acidiphilum TaxID=121039 RepID=A0ABV3Y0M8_9ACTN|nr:protoporphyrinogen oxidase [Ferrimicrobium sp.]
MTKDSHSIDVVIIGGGIAGLTVAHELIRSRAGITVTLLEAGAAPGGKIQSANILGNHPIDVGPDALLTASGAVRKLCEELGLADALAYPTNGTTGIYHRGSICAVPPGLISGVPVSPVSLARSPMLSLHGMLRASGDLVLPRKEFTAASTVADMVISRVGAEVLTNFVEPLIGGMYAGDTRYLSAKYATPPLFQALQQHRSLLMGLRRRPRTTSRGGLGTFAPGGLTTLVDALTSAISPVADLRTATPARSLHRSPAGWVVNSDDDSWSSRHVVVALPAPQASQLLFPTFVHQAELLRSVEYASVITVTLALPPQPHRRSAIPGCVVPRSDEHLITALTCISDRWEHHRLPDAYLVRCSLGRHGDERAWLMTDEEIIQRVRTDVTSILRIDASTGDAVLKRWENALPQYGPQHGAMLESLGEIEADNVSLVGAAYRGVGIASCIEHGKATAERILGRL